MSLASYGFSLEDRGLSAEQQGKVMAFKRRLQQSGAWDDRFFDEHDCARFLKARNYDFQAAKQMWDSMLVWRRENRVDTIRDWFVFHERQEYARVFPTGLHKTDKEGHPVLIQQLGRVNIGALYKITTDDRIRLAHIAENEHLRRVVFPACSRAAGWPIDQLFTIIDLEGIAFTSMMRTTSLLKMFMTMDSNNYPETLARMAIINAPGWFSTSWSAVKSVLSGDTVRKIEIFGKDYQAALLRHIPRENLLVEYGGLSRGRVTDNEGPWQQQQQSLEGEEQLLLPSPPASPSPHTTSLAVTAAAATVHGAGRATVATAAVAMAGVIVEPPAPGRGGEAMELSGGGGGRGADQLTPRDVATRRSQSPVRPGAKAIPASGASHPAPPASPPLAKRPHHEEQQQQPSASPALGQAGLGPGSGSPAPSLSDSASESAHNMAAPLLSNFLSATESPSPSPQQQQQQQQHPLQHMQRQQQPLLAAAQAPSPHVSAGGAPTAVPPLPLPRRSSGGGGGLVAGIVATLQAAVGHVGMNAHQTTPQRHSAVAAAAAASAAAPAAAAEGVLRPPLGPSAPGSFTLPQTPLLHHQQQQLPPHQQHHQLLAMARGGASGPAQLLLSSPREDTTGPGTVLSAVSAVYSPPSLMSPLSPIDLQAVADTATSRRTDGGTSSGQGGQLSVSSALGTGGGGSVGVGGAMGVLRRSGGGASAGGVAGSMPSFAGSGVSTFASVVMSSGELLPAGGAAGAAAAAPQLALAQQPQSPAQQQSSSQQQQQLSQQQSQDTDDAESVRISVMSQRSFYSALSHLDQSSSSGITSPNEASENARRWSMQRELHAAAIASALAATAERRAAATATAAAAAAAGGDSSMAAAVAGGSLATVVSSGKSHTGATVGVPSASALSGVSYIIPPASQQAFGSYLDQPPSYGALRTGSGSESFTNGNAAAPLRDDGPDVGAPVAGAGVVAPGTTAGGGHRSRGGVPQTLDAVTIQMGNDNNGGGSISRSPSAATIEDCSLGAGAVRWARGWFFRRRNYGRLVDGDGTGDGLGMGAAAAAAATGGAGPGPEGGRQGGTMLIARGGKGGGGVGSYSSMHDGPGTTSPSKLMPKMPSVPHHGRGDSWEWDQPSPYDIDQTYGRGGGGGGGSGAMLRDVSFGRGGERRRLLRSESPGRRRGAMAAYCGCLPCCIVM